MSGTERQNKVGMVQTIELCFTTDQMVWEAGKIEKFIWSTNPLNNKMVFVKTIEWMAISNTNQNFSIRTNRSFS